MGVTAGEGGLVVEWLVTSDTEGQPCQGVKTFWVAPQAWAARWARRDGGGDSQAEEEKR